jgi:heptosyltransferase-2
LLKIKKLLFLAEGQLGDSIVLMPAIKAVKQHFPDTEVNILMFHRVKFYDNVNFDNFILKNSFQGVSQVFKFCPYADNVYEINRSWLRSLRGFSKIKSELKCIRYLKSQNFDAVISTFPQNRFYIWSFLARIKIRIGEKNQGFDFLLTHKLPVKRSDSGVMNYFCSLLKPLGIQQCDNSNYFFLSEELRQFGKKAMINLGFSQNDKILIIHPGASNKDRQYPPAKLANLIREIKRLNIAKLLMLYSNYDEEFIIDLKKYLNEEITFYKTESVAELASLISVSYAILCNNSGPRHLAAALGIKTVALLEKYDDIMWKIYDDALNHKIIQSNTNCNMCKESKCYGYIPEGEKFGAYCMHDINEKNALNTVKNLFGENLA